MQTTAYSATQTEGYSGAHSPGDVPAESPVRRGVLIFAHPFVVTWTAIWLLNDHVLKGIFGSWWTGKLSDIAGLIVFPLILAVLIERRSSRPIEWGIAATIVFYGSINVFPAADAVTETVIGAFIGPVTLTMDSTDLLVLPALVGAWWAWSRARRSSLRRSWGRVVFTGALATTVATSSSSESEVFSGTAFLTEDMASIEMPITFTIDGEPSGDVDAFETTLAVIPYGGAATNPVEYSIEFSEAGSGVFSLALAPGVTGPVEVRWSVAAVTRGGGGGLLSGGPELNPALAVDAPADTFGPEPALETSWTTPGEGDPGARRLTVEASPDTTIRLLVTNGVVPNTVRVVTEETSASLGQGAPVDLELPSRCGDTGPCRFDVYVAGASRWDRLDLAVLALGGNADVVDQGTVEMTRYTVTGTTAPYRFDAPGQRRVDYEISYAPLAGPVDDALTFVDVMFDEVSGVDDVVVNVPFPQLDFADACCGEGAVNAAHDGNGRVDTDDFDAPVDVTLSWEAVVWTPGEIDPNSIQFSVGEL